MERWRAIRKCTNIRSKKRDRHSKDITVVLQTRMACFSKIHSSSNNFSKRSMLHNSRKSFNLWIISTISKIIQRHKSRIQLIRLPIHMIKLSNKVNSVNLYIAIPSKWVQVTLAITHSLKNLAKWVSPRSLSNQITIYLRNIISSTVTRILCPMVRVDKISP